MAQILNLEQGSAEWLAIATGIATRPRRPLCWASRPGSLRMGCGWRVPGAGPPR